MGKKKLGAGVLSCIALSCVLAACSSGPHYNNTSYTPTTRQTLQPLPTTAAISQPTQHQTISDSQSSAQSNVNTGTEFSNNINSQTTHATQQDNTYTADTATDTPSTIITNPETNFEFEPNLPSGALRIDVNRKDYGQQLITNLIDSGVSLTLDNNGVVQVTNPSLLPSFYLTTTDSNGVIQSDVPKHSNYGNDQVIYTEAGDLANGLIYRDTGVLYAKRQGFTGAGLTVAIADSGVFSSADNSVLGKATRVTLSSSSHYSPNHLDANTSYHGTAVASIIAGTSENPGGYLTSYQNYTINGVKYEGVAKNSQIIDLPLQFSESSTSYDLHLTEQVLANQDGDLEDLFTTMLSTDAVVMNNSWGYNSAVDYFSTEVVTRSLPKTINVLRQENEMDEDKTIIVFAAGNSYHRDFAVNDDEGFRIVGTGATYALSPSVIAGISYHDSEINSVISVAATEQRYEAATNEYYHRISFYSNRCGVAKDFCITAPGYVLASRRALRFVGGPSPYEYVNRLANVTGTSFAAPLVSGSLLLLMEAFPTVGNVEIKDRLLNTANNCDTAAEEAKVFCRGVSQRDDPVAGTTAFSDIYGKGFLDLEAALQPVGDVNFALENRGLLPLSNLLLPTSSTLQNFFSSALSNFSLTGFDEHNFPFVLQAEQFIVNNPQSYTNRFLSSWTDHHQNSSLVHKTTQGTRQLLFSKESSLGQFSSNTASLTMNTTWHNEFSGLTVGAMRQQIGSLHFTASAFSHGKDLTDSTSAGMSLSFEQIGRKFSYAVDIGYLQQQGNFLGSVLRYGEGESRYLIGSYAYKHPSNWFIATGLSRLEGNALLDQGILHSIDNLLLEDISLTTGINNKHFLLSFSVAKTVTASANIESTNFSTARTRSGDILYSNQALNIKLPSDIRYGIKLALLNKAISFSIEKTNTWQLQMNWSKNF